MNTHETLVGKSQITTHVNFLGVNKNFRLIVYFVLFN